MISHLYKNLLAKSFTSWFAELAAFAEQTDDSSRLPKLELSLRSGHVIRGSILNVQQTAHEQTLLLLGLPDSYTKSEITFVSASEVIALTLLEPENYVKDFVNPPDPQQVGTLELKRAVQNVEAELEKNLQYRLPIQVNVNEIPEKARWDVLRTIGFLPSLFASIASDELGKTQLQQIATVRVQVSDQSKTTLLHNVLTVSVVSPLSVSVAKEKERLKTEIERLL